MTTGNNVYRFLNDKSEIIYIGLSADLTYRMETHKVRSPFFHEVDTIEYAELKSSTDMRITELILINEFQPIYNVADKDIEPTVYKSLPLNWKIYEPYEIYKKGIEDIHNNVLINFEQTSDMYISKTNNDLILKRYKGRTQRFFENGYLLRIEIDSLIDVMKERDKTNYVIRTFYIKGKQSYSETVTTADNLMERIEEILSKVKINKQTKAGLESARRQGRIGGRPNIKPAVKRQIRALYDSGERVIDIAKEYDIARSTVYKVLKESDLQESKAGG